MARSRNLSYFCETYNGWAIFYVLGKHYLAFKPGRRQLRGDNIHNLRVNIDAVGLPR